MSPAEEVRSQQRVAANHIDWFRKLATRGQLLFPELQAATVAAAIDTTVDDARASGVEASCWSLLPAQPVDLGAWLLARGFQWGWQPHWMRLTLADWRNASPCPPGVVIERATERHSFRDELPNYSLAEAEALRALPDSEAVHLVATEDSEVIGHAVVSRCAENNSAGIYSCGVVETARRRGTGAALTAAACLVARQWNCEDVLLNATAMGEPVYRRVGFVSCGLGQTWWLHERAMRTPPDTSEVTFVERIGRGLVEGLEPVGGRDLDGPLRCGSTPVEVAVLCKQPDSVEWLVAQGATLDLVSCWNLGWRNRAAGALIDATRPREPEARRAGPHATTRCGRPRGRGPGETRAVRQARPCNNGRLVPCHGTGLGALPGQRANAAADRAGRRGALARPCRLAYPEPT